MQVTPNDFRGWLQVAFSAVEVAIVSLTLIIVFGFPHGGIPTEILVSWIGTIATLILSTIICYFYDRHIANTGVITLGFVALFIMG